MGYIYIADSTGSDFSEFDAVNSSICRLVRNNAKQCHWPVKGHTRSPIFLPIENPIDFLLVNKTKLCTISHRFWVTAYMCNYKLSLLARGASIWLHRSEWTPELGTAKLGFKNQRHHSIVWCTNHFDILNHLGADHQCDRRTDRQTGRITIALACV